MKQLGLFAAAGSAAIALAMVGTAHAATTVGAIYACYACQATGNAAVDAALAANPDVATDGLLFEFVNTSGSAITGGVFDLSAGSYTDSFSVGPIAAGGDVIFIPGKSNDLGVHPSNSLFFHTGNTMDTSDGDGTVSDSSAFSFVGVQGASSVTSGVFHAGDPALIQPFRDNPLAGRTSFLGDGPSGDGPCNNCYYAQIATLSIPASGAPEPAQWVLMLTGFALAGASLRRRRAALAA